MTCVATPGWHQRLVDERPCTKAILIVEDDEAIREGLRLLLEDEGYFVECACNGREALAMLERMPPPCVVLLDLMMPVMDGYEFLRVTQASEPWRTLPITVVSAAPDTSRIKARRVFRKPVPLGSLLRAVDEDCLRGSDAC